MTCGCSIYVCFVPTLPFLSFLSFVSFNSIVPSAYSIVGRVTHPSGARCADLPCLFYFVHLVIHKSTTPLSQPTASIKTSRYRRNHGCTYFHSAYREVCQVLSWKVHKSLGQWGRIEVSTILPSVPLVLHTRIQIGLEVERETRENCER